MNINRNVKLETVGFKEIEPFGYFELDQDLYIKLDGYYLKKDLVEKCKSMEEIQELLNADEGIFENAVRLGDTELTYFEDNADVIPIPADTVKLNYEINTCE